MNILINEFSKEQRKLDFELQKLCMQLITTILYYFIT